MQRDLGAEAVAQDAEGEASPAMPARPAATPAAPEEAAAPTARATGRLPTPGGAPRNTAGDTVRNTKNTALTQELRRSSTRVATVHKSNFPITLDAIRSKLQIKFGAVPLDSVPAETVIQIGRSLEDNQAT
jgi:hypothetical protein